MTTVALPQPLKVGALAIVGLLIASSWLVFPYFIQGQQLLRGVGDDARLIKAGSVSRYLTRQLVYAPELELTATFATDEFFQYVDQAAVVGNLRPDRNLIFFVNETIHTGDLPERVPDVTLRVGGDEYTPQVADGPRNAQHHRVTVYSFARRDDAGNVIDVDGFGGLELEVSGSWFDQALSFAGRWEAPYSLPEALKSRADITPVAMLALGAGLLSSVLTPCLLQLVVMFGGVIAGFSTVPGAPVGNSPAVAGLVRRKIMQIAVAFVLGFVVLYALAGALIGAVGHQAQLLFAEYSRAIAVASGVIVILLGLWVGLRGARPQVCAMPSGRLREKLSGGDTIGTLIASMGYALGCTACFGGAIVATLIVYVGAIGSAAIGAGIMLTFAVGVAIPFLLAAWFTSRMDSAVDFLARNAQPLSYASMVVIVAFGLILVTDNFHTVSDLIYPYLGLG